MTTIREGGCLCGACRYSVTGPPKFHVKCYCRDCQRISGAGHLPQITFTADGFDLSGPVGHYQSKSDEGSDLEFMFCTACGSSLAKTTTKAQGLVFVTAGTLDDPSIFTPKNHVYEHRRLPWDPR